ncbi:MULTISPECIES: glycosyltransferase family 4 protein [unclassified Streptomyces]|uniref:glycosyltransferase family 4 protein n=1 Tax=unclassified Streptomyces TaxID=2593676 RepID=UPI0035DE7D7A
MSQLRTVQVLDGGAGSSAHVSSLAAGLVARGVQVTVCAPAGSGRAHGLPGSGARFVAVPRRSDPAAVAALRTACTGADIVHAHGLHAALRAGIALSGRGTPLVMTWHTRVHAEGARGRLLRFLERRAARAAAVVLGTSWELVDRARRRGARDARLAPAPIPASRFAGTPDDGKARAELGATGRPLLVSVAQHGQDALLDAARAWRTLDPVPLLAVVGEGDRAGALRRRIAAEGLPVVLADDGDGIDDLLAAADLAVLCGHGEGGPLLAREALRLGVPLVAARTDGLPELVGDAAALVPYGDAEALAGAVVGLLDDPARRERLADSGRVRAAGWPTEEDTIAHVLSVYDELAQPPAGDRA